MASTFTPITEELHDYLLAVSLRETDAQKQLREETSGMDRSVMQISPEQGQLMQLLVKMIRAKRCIEIGVFTGYSTLSVALALPDDGKIIACDINQAWTDTGKKYWQAAGVEHKIELRIAEASNTLNQLLEAGQQASFDFAFIDADKSNYDNYYELCLKLIRKGGLIVIDNTLWDGKVINPEFKDPDTEAIQQLNEKIHKDQRVAISLLPMSDGLTLALKK